ncbi:DUF3263 domain-containing protein [Streptomyces microflavus]|uniref:DUF3263 domain-containing protein n=1 Tax=Streptomyces microflavus TaxID=1919 RepID=UPI002DD8477F|nr:DUF3263 domain-containing protein [Streptomyces microflavus]WSA62307.1 DUF3263 domain-containing protein [Streptomyces microflavus]WSS35008.1 DUF3263 domain-containing protein [Streptomyces microflavus]WST16423.1 DUF3263 domain-containing protein [Streptomyces microflavus]
MTAPDAEPASEPAPASPVAPEPSGPAGPAPADRELSVRERAVLALERRSWAGPGAKERAIREELGISPVRYFQLLNALIEDERALREDPVTVNRLRRLREARRDRR